MPALPTGTVTFLFTDIEGSTKLWEKHPDAMRVALARHDLLLRQTIENNNGYVFKTIGDAFCAAFPTAPDALNAALATQLALHSEPWPDALSLRVRMALHTGAAELRDDDYFGQPLNRVARLLGAGHGGQILLSDVAHDLTRDTLPSAAALKPLGEHRLRDLGRPEPVFQLLHPDLPSKFPPLKSLDNPELPNNLPQQVTSFIGRDKEIETIKSLLSKTRLLTLTGSGGCGKTRLGLQVAADVLENYPDGAWLVELASLADPALIPQAVASVLDVREEAGKPLVQTLVEFLKAQRLLLVFDNCEHVLDACARLADALLKSCSHVQILVSSREALGIAGEQTYRIPSLSLPDARQEQTIESVSQYEAVRLFIERALAVQSTFAVTNANAPVLAQLCVRLDGIPLALELAAARVRSLSVEEINGKLDNRFRLLTGGSRTALPRQQTLRALIDWSYDLLNAQEKTLLSRLSVFAGGWTLGAAEAVGTGEGIEDWEVLDLLTSLTDKSLVVAEQEQGQTRYRLLETVRQYAQDRLAESKEGESVRERHQGFFVALVEEAAPQLQGQEGAKWLDRLESEHDNFRAALERNNEAALHIVGALWWFWLVRGYITEGRKWLTDTLASPVAQAGTPARANALYAAGGLAYSQGDNAAAHSLYAESLALFRQLGNKLGLANSLGNLGIVAIGQGDYATARPLYEESLALFRQLENKRGIANSLGNLGVIVHEQGDYAEAHSLYQESLALFRELADKRSIGNALMNLGNVASEQGAYAEAQPLYEQSLALCRESGNKLSIANSLVNLGNVTHRQGDYAAAHSLYEECLALYQELGNKLGLANSLLNLGSVVSEQGEYTRARGLYEESLALSQEMGDKRGITCLLEAFAALASRQEQTPRAAQCWGAAEALREAIGAPLSPSERVRYDQQVAQARSTMGEDAFAADWTQGRAMTMEQSIEYALKKQA